MTSQSGNWIIYDGECPFCSNYVRFTKLKDTIGPVRLINARDGGPEVDYVKAAGLDLDEGMVLHYQGQDYHGDKCLNMLALMSSDNGFFNKLNAALFSSAAVAKLSYPFLRFGRNTTLMLLGRKKLNEKLLS
jgi:DCC1-like thiol-disulfide oxidoreductase